MRFGDDTTPRFYALTIGLALVLLCAVSTRRAVEQGVSGAPVVPRVHPVEMRPDPARLEELARTLDARVSSGELLLGHALLELNHAERRQLDDARAFDLKQATARYDHTLERVRTLAYEERLGVVAGVVRGLKAEGFTAYNRVNARISDGLMTGAANCEGTTHLLVSLLTDLGLGGRVFIRAYSNHVSPELVLEGHARHFGLTNGCPGPGTRMLPGELLRSYRAGRPDALGSFAYPTSRKACADVGLLFDPEPPIVEHDENGRLWQKAQRAPKGCAYPRPETVRSDQYEAQGESGSVLVERVIPSKERLAEHSQKIACAEALLAKKLQAREDRLPFLGAAAGLYQQAAVLYAAAGLGSVVEELGRRQSKVVREAEVLLASVDWKSPAGERLLEQLSTRDSWPLKFLGDAGRDVLLKMVRRHEANYALSVLVRDAATRAEALEIVGSRSEAEQLEILGSLDLENPWFHADLSREPRAKPLLLAEGVSLALAARWRSCELDDLEALAREELQRARLAERWGGPIVVQLGTRAVAARCPGGRLGDDLLEFAHSRTPTLAPRLQSELRIIRMMR